MRERSPADLEKRARQLFDESVENVDMRVRSRLTQARHAALAAAARPRARFMGVPIWPSAAGVCAAALLGVAIWVGVPSSEHRLTASESQSSFEDMDIVASTEEGSGDALEMLQDDVEFYDWVADKSASPDGNDLG